MGVKRGGGGHNPTKMPGIHKQSHQLTPQNTKQTKEKPQAIALQFPSPLLEHVQNVSLM